jgi:hypothetical protein
MNMPFATLNKFQMKLVYIVRTVVIVLSLGLLGVGIWMRTFASTFFEEPSLFFPMILGGCWLLNVYRFNKELKLCNGKITWFRLKCHLFIFLRVIFFSLAYFTIMMHYFWQTVHMLFWAAICILVQCLLYYVESKKIKTHEHE